MIITTSDNLKEFIFMNREKAHEPLFALTYGPMLASYPELAKILDKLSMDCPYYIPFKYIGYMLHMTKNTSAQVCKEFLKNAGIDIDTLKRYYYHSNPNIDEKCKAAVELITSGTVAQIHEFIKTLRGYQIKNGITESAMLNYAPIVPYDGVIKKSTEGGSFPNDRAFPKLITTYSKSIDPETSSVFIDSALEILLNNTAGVIQHYNLLYKFTSIHDIVMEFDFGQINKDIVMYYALMYLLNKDPKLTVEELEEFDNAIMTVYSRKKTPIKEDEFNRVFETFCSIDPGSYERMISSESWSMFESEAQRDIERFLDGIKKNDSHMDVYNLDMLTSKIYTMRHIELCQYANNYLLSLEDLIITDYNYVGNDIFACEINGQYLAVPYVDIADNYRVKIITIDRNQNIEIFNDIRDLSDDQFNGPAENEE